MKKKRATIKSTEIDAKEWKIYKETKYTHYKKGRRWRRFFLVKEDVPHYLYSWFRVFPILFRSGSRFPILFRRLSVRTMGEAFWEAQTKFSSHRPRGNLWFEAQDVKKKEVCQRLCVRTKRRMLPYISK